jgi:hypothetical protein
VLSPVDWMGADGWTVFVAQSGHCPLPEETRDWSDYAQGAMQSLMIRVVEGRVGSGEDEATRLSCRVLRLHLDGRVHGLVYAPLSILRPYHLALGAFRRIRRNVPWRTYVDVWRRQRELSDLP